MSIFDNEVVAPDDLGIAAKNGNEQAITAWFRRVVTYYESMEDLGRAVLLKRTEEGQMYLSSIPSGEDA